jgi:hypothetical protein
MRYDPIELVEHVRAFNGDSGEAFARIHFGPTRSWVPVRSRAFRDWFFLQFWNQYSSAPSAARLASAIRFLESVATTECDIPQSVTRRIAHGTGRQHPDSVYLDLGNPARESVAIRPDGWDIGEDDSVFFESSRSSCPLPKPAHSDDPPAVVLKRLRSVLNFPGRAEWLRVLGWLLACFNFCRF